MPPKNDAESTAEVTAGEASLRDDVEVLKGDLLRIKDDLALIADGLRDRVRAQARSTREQAQSQYQDSVESIEQYIEEKPLTTVLVAFGLGLILGKIFSLK